jgi:hypothetical protein
MRRWQGQSLESALSHSHSQLYRNSQAAHDVRKQKRATLKLRLRERTPDATVLEDYLVDASSVSPTLTSNQDTLRSLANGHQIGTAVQAIDPSLNWGISVIAQTSEENLNQSWEGCIENPDPQSHYSDSPEYFLCNDQDMELFPGVNPLEKIAETCSSPEDICDDAEGEMVF